MLSTDNRAPVSEEEKKADAVPGHIDEFFQELSLEDKKEETVSKKKREKKSFETPKKGSRSSLRIQKKETPDKFEAKEGSEVWYLISTDKEIEEGGRGLVNRRRFMGHHARVVTYRDTNGIGALADVSKNEVVFLHGHCGKMGQVLRTGSLGKIRLGPQAFAKHLDEEAQLSKDHQTLVLYVCYSNVFISDLYKAMHARGYTRLQMIGYKGQCSPASPFGGREDQFTAGLFGAALSAVKDKALWDEMITVEAYDSNKHRVVITALGEVDEIRRVNYEEHLARFPHFAINPESSVGSPAVLPVLAPSSLNVSLGSASSTMDSVPPVLIPPSAPSSTSISLASVAEKKEEGELAVGSSSATILSQLNNPSTHAATTVLLAVKEDKRDAPSSDISTQLAVPSASVMQDSVISVSLAVANAGSSLPVTVDITVNSIPHVASHLAFLGHRVSTSSGAVEVKAAPTITSVDPTGSVPSVVLR